jgi:RNA polymerase sigma factor (sigma-70 family)
MADPHPPELTRLFTAFDPPTHEAAWAAFVTAHSRLLLHTARSVNQNHDAAMDGYAFVLEALRADDYRRLREYKPDGRTKFTTWLVVVARRLCLDLLRRRYGRTDSEPQRKARRSLTDLVTHADPDALPAPAAGPSLEGMELTDALNAATSRLSSDDRVLLKLRFEDELSASEISRLLGFPTPFHVYRRLNALLAQLRNALRQRGIDEAQP